MWNDILFTDVGKHCATICLSGDTICGLLKYPGRVYWNKTDKVLKKNKILRGKKVKLLFVHFQLHLSTKCLELPQNHKMFLVNVEMYKLHNSFSDRKHVRTSSDFFLRWVCQRKCSLHLSKVRTLVQKQKDFQSWTFSLISSSSSSACTSPTALPLQLQPPLHYTASDREPSVGPTLICSSISPYKLKWAVLQLYHKCQRSPEVGLRKEDWGKFTLKRYKDQHLTLLGLAIKKVSR